MYPAIGGGCPDNLLIISPGPRYLFAVHIQNGIGRRYEPEVVLTSLARKEFSAEADTNGMF